MPKTKKDADLTTLSLDELRSRYQEVTGEETKDRSKKHLIERIEEARRSIAAIEGKEADEAPADATAPETPEEGTETSPVETAPTEEPEVTPETNPEDDAPEGEKKLSKMTVEELRAAYTEIVGRETRSSNSRYLQWRLAQARKGRIPVGPRARRGSSGPCKVLPVRLPEAAVGPLAEAKERLGLPSRNDLFLKAVYSYLAQNGEAEVAALIADDSAAE